MTKLSNIPLALETRLAAMANAPLIAWPNITFNFDADVIYLRPQVSVGRSTRMGYGANDKLLHHGIYQVDVFAPKDEGASAAMVTAQAVIDHFPKNLELSTGSGKIKIVNTDIESAGSNVGSHYQICVLINFVTVIA